MIDKKYYPSNLKESCIKAPSWTSPCLVLLRVLSTGIVYIASHQSCRVLHTRVLDLTVCNRGVSLVVVREGDPYVFSSGLMRRFGRLVCH